jgi:spermidine/putrescine transport system ATP-binding protein
MIPRAQPHPDGAVSIRGVSRFYGAVRGVENLDLEIAPGEFFTLLGASGSGKTTMLRLIAGFEQATTGRIFIGGRDETDLRAYRRNVHTVFQDYALFPHLTVSENVAFALDLKKTAKAEIHTKVEAALALVELAGFGARLPAQLSGGQQQRVALARAIVDRPAVLLLDEPLSALDAKIRAELREGLKRLQRETGITFIYVTHDQEEALTLSDRLAVMSSGHVLQVGTPIEVYEKPADLYVAEFIGKANFVRGTLAKLESQRAVVQTGEYAFGGTTVAPLAIGSAVRLMVRPENVQLSTSDHDGIPAGISQVNYLGPATEYLLESALGLFRALELRRMGSTPHTEGARLHMTWKPEEALVYLDHNL